ALRVACDLAQARTGRAVELGRGLEARALRAMFFFATSELASSEDRAALARELARFEPALLVPSSAGALEGLVALRGYLDGPEVGRSLPWDEESLLRAHFYWFLPAACALVHDEPRAERVVRLGAEWSQAVDEKGRTDAEALLAEIE